MTFIEVNQERLHCAQAGDGPAVLCIHGLGSSSAMWQVFEDAMSDRYAVHSIDCRGHGESTCNGPPTIDDMADDLSAATDALGLDAIHVIGVSMGAQVAVRLYDKAPERVHSLVLCGGVLKAGNNLEDELYGIREAVFYLSEADFAQQTAEALLSADAPGELAGNLAADMEKLGQKRYLEGLESFAASDNTTHAGGITAPTLVLRGEFDDLIKPEETDALTKAIRGARQEIIKGGGHFACLDGAAAFNQAVAEFVEAAGR